MPDFPFPADTIQDHRFHGLIEGTFEMDGDHVQLKTTFGAIRLMPRGGKGGARAFYAAWKNAENHPDAVIRAYGYPRTTPAGMVHRMELCSWHLAGSPPPNAKTSLAHRFEPGQLFLCGRVRALKDGLVTVKVTSVVAGRELRWWVNGLLVVRPLKTVSPPVRPARRPAAGASPVQPSGRSNPMRRNSATLPTWSIATRSWVLYADTPATSPAA